MKQKEKQEYSQNISGSGNGWKLCRKCYQQSVHFHDEEQTGTLHESQMDCNYQDSLSHNDNPESVMHVGNTSLDISGVSPIMCHGIKKRRRVASVKEKRQRSFRWHEMQATMSIGIHRKELD